MYSPNFNILLDKCQKSLSKFISSILYGVSYYKVPSFPSFSFLFPLPYPSTISSTYPALTLGHTVNPGKWHS